MMLSESFLICAGAESTLAPLETRVHRCSPGVWILHTWKQVSSIARSHSSRSFKDLRQKESERDRLSSKQTRAAEPSRVCKTG